MDALTRNNPIDYTLDADLVLIHAGNITVLVKQTRRRVTVKLYRYGKLTHDALAQAFASQIEERE